MADDRDGAAAAHRRPALVVGAPAGGLVIDDRLARAGLSRLAEPGDTRVPAAVEHVGAVTLFEDVLAQRGDHERTPGSAARPRLVDDTATPAGRPRPGGRPRAAPRGRASVS